MARDVVSAKLDIIFKKFFTENQDMLHSFLASMLDIPAESISEIHVTNPEIPPESVSGKFSRLDLNMKVDDRLVNVEIQVKNDRDYRDRVLFYWAKLYTSELKSGDNYGALKQAICINIINFNMFDGEAYHNEVMPVVKQTGEVFSDKMSIHFFELKKVGKKPNPKNSRELWLQFINADSEEDFEMINQTNIPIMQKAVRVIYDMSEDTRVRENARMREKALHDEASALFNAKNEGRAEGLVEGENKGRSEERAELTERMRLLGLSEEQIKAIINK
ncbi:MAG: Rpn family recombination-promoting nuclease/putative transposase [Ruminococcus sp.]|nr:Rpn family recombination-promoting nuclease/putative transposase [Ruminococcus sp.]MCM1380749.1 Rpn family recombination-promoting nuclease/putative transposase [Muribaculaceae bacterium]MCM1478709.1 Rpn family recombination-promoting nuclease/putative transposase [Muribaculaceae bacterium]